MKSYLLKTLAVALIAIYYKPLAATFIEIKRVTIDQFDLEQALFSHKFEKDFERATGFSGIFYDKHAQLDSFYLSCEGSELNHDGTLLQKSFFVPLEKKSTVGFSKDSSNFSIYWRSEKNKYIHLLSKERFSLSKGFPSVFKEGQNISLSDCIWTYIQQIVKADYSALTNQHENENAITNPNQLRQAIIVLQQAAMAQAEAEWLFYFDKCPEDAHMTVLCRNNNFAHPNFRFNGECFNSKDYFSIVIVIPNKDRKTLEVVGVCIDLELFNYLFEIDKSLKSDH
jgi:hypothetical protein